MAGVLRERSRTGSAVLLLGLSVLTTAALALQAHYAHTYQRETAEQFLRDLARLAGHELVRRCTAQLGSEGYVLLLATVARREQSGGSLTGLPGSLAVDPDPRLRRAAPLARRVFAASRQSPEIAFAPGPPPPAVAAWLRAKLAEGRAPGGPMTALHGMVDGAPRSFLFGERDGEIVGFEMELERLGSTIRSALDDGPLLPPSVGNGHATNEALLILVRDHGNVERFRSGTIGADVPLATELPFGEAYSGILDGSRVWVAVSPGAVREVVVGGLPRSRLPILLGLLGLSAALVVTALLQLHRERALQRLRTEFVASVSHELRTPLTQIRLFAETLLLDRVRTPAERHQALTVIDREARRLGDLVENVLLFARAERRRSTLAPERQALAPLVRTALARLEPLARGSGARLAAELDEEASAVVDPTALQQVLSNLFDNALKYGPRGQEVRVAVERRGATVRLSVEDQGPGVPAAERRRVFERFHRLERDRRSAVAGTGIGLALVDDLARRQGGRVFVEDGAGGGARFVVELPS
jgi:signal transduction histidine kinase